MSWYFWIPFGPEGHQLKDAQFREGMKGSSSMAILQNSIVWTTLDLFVRIKETLSISISKFSIFVERSVAIEPLI